MKWLLAALSLLLALVLVGGGLFGDRKGALNVIGSTSVQPFAEMLAQEFQKTEHGFVVDVQGGGSTAGIQAVLNHVAEVGMCSRALKKEEQTVFQSWIVARDGLAVVVHPSNPVANLSREQIRGLFSGQITHWASVGGPDRPVRLIVREEGSGTREAFTNLVMIDPKTKTAVRVSRRALTQESNGAVQELVRHDPSAVGYMSLGLVGQELKAIHVDGVEPTIAAALEGRYPLVRPFLFVTQGPPSAQAREFIDFILSEPAQAMLEMEGLVRAK